MNRKRPRGSGARPDIYECRWQTRFVNALVKCRNEDIARLPMFPGEPMPVLGKKHTGAADAYRSLGRLLELLSGDTCPSGNGMPINSLEHVFATLTARYRARTGTAGGPHRIGNLQACSIDANKSKGMRTFDFLHPWAREILWTVDEWVTGHPRIEMPPNEKLASLVPALVPESSFVTDEWAGELTAVLTKFAAMCRKRKPELGPLTVRLPGKHGKFTA